MADEQNCPPGNVTPLPVRFKDEPKMIARAGFDYLSADSCRHRNVLVDERLTEIECADCHAKVNPIWYLGQLANQLRLWDARLEEIAKARQNLEERSRCRCTKCGEMTEIRSVGNRELKLIKGRNDARPG